MEEKLTLLKANLQMLTSSNDTYLTFLLETADASMKREGASDDSSVEYKALQVDYAAYLFRKRAADSSGGKEGETAMPRFLRYRLNNLIFGQKIQEGMA